jgi:DUF1365 family protein
MTASALYRGEIRHRRMGAQAGDFTHPITLAYLDLDELPTLLGGRLVGPRPGVVRVRRRDLLGGADGPPVADAVRALVAERTGRPAADGPIRVLTAPRTFGTAFNPVSFYYSFDRDEHLDAVVAEVTSTPWLERHAYVLRGDAPDDAAAPVLHGEHVKVLHVSPFQDMDHQHVWSVAQPGATLAVHIENHRTAGGDKDFDATLRLVRQPLTASSLRAATARQLGGAPRTLALIYGHAIALKLRGARHFRRPVHSAPDPRPTTR